MDGQRFDELAKVLARGVSRRDVLQWLGGGLTGLGLASLVPAPARAREEDERLNEEELGRRLRAAASAMRDPVPCAILARHARGSAYSRGARGARAKSVPALH